MGNIADLQLMECLNYCGREYLLSRRSMGDSDRDSDMDHGDDKQEYRFQRKLQE